MAQTQLQKIGLCISLQQSRYAKCLPSLLAEVAPNLPAYRQKKEEVPPVYWPVLPSPPPPPGTNILVRSPMKCPQLCVQANGMHKGLTWLGLCQHLLKMTKS